MKNIFKITAVLAFIFAVTFIFAPELAAQCPMCKMSAEQNLKAGGTAGIGLNAGILYMFFMPYIIVATLGFIWYRNRKKAEEADILEELREISEEMA